jgi:hypothetical protein
VRSAAGTLKNSGFSSEVLLMKLGWRGRSTTPPSTPPFGIVYEGALANLLQLDLVIYEIIYERKKREVYYFYVHNFPGGTMIPVALIDMIWRKDQVAMTTKTKRTKTTMTSTMTTMMIKRSEEECVG